MGTCTDQRICQILRFEPIITVCFGHCVVHYGSRFSTFRGLARLARQLFFAPAELGLNRDRRSAMLNVLKAQPGQTMLTAVANKRKLEIATSTSDDVTPSKLLSMQEPV